MNLVDSLYLKTPWLIVPEALGAMFDAGRTLFKANPEAAEPVASPLLAVKDGIGTVTLRGPMMRNPDRFARAFFNATNTEDLAAALREAAGRADVRAVLLDIDSPGGSVNGTPELAQAVADLSQTKRIYAFSAGQMCSAAYWVASQADAIYATPSARVGSIGVILPVLDSSGAFEQMGLKMEVFAAGKFKGAGTPGTQLSDDQRAWLQADVEEIATEFKSAVLARGRQIPNEAMEGQTFSGRKAATQNLAAVVADRGEALARLALVARTVDSGGRAMSQATKTIEQELADAQGQITLLQADAESLQATVTTQAGQITILTGERDQARANLDISRSELTTAQESVRTLTARNTELEAAEKDVESRASRRAAEIVAATGTQAPARVTPQGEPKVADDLYERFKAITDPREQTTFWRSLSAQQQALILSKQA